MATPQKASIIAEKNKQGFKNNGSNGTKRPGPMHVLRHPPTTKNTESGNSNTTIPKPPMDNKSVVTSTLPQKSPNSSRATTTPTRTTKNEQLVTIANSIGDSRKIGCATNLPPIVSGGKAIPHTLGENSNSSNLRKVTNHVGNLSEKMGQTEVLTNTIVDTIGNKQSSCTTDWLPQMDGIEIDLPSSATTMDHEMKINEEMAKTEAYIQNVLYGQGLRRPRLPVFEEICPSHVP